MVREVCYKSSLRNLANDVFGKSEVITRLIDSGQHALTHHVYRVSVEKEQGIELQSRTQARLI